MWPVLTSPFSVLGWPGPRQAFHAWPTWRVNDSERSVNGQRSTNAAELSDSCKTSHILHIVNKWDMTHLCFHYVPDCSTRTSSALQHQWLRDFKAATILWYPISHISTSHSFWTGNAMNSVSPCFLEATEPWLQVHVLEHRIEFNLVGSKKSTVKLNVDSRPKHINYWIMLFLHNMYV